MRQGMVISFLAIGFMLAFAATYFQQARFDTRSRAQRLGPYDPVPLITPTPTPFYNSGQTGKSCQQICADMGKTLVSWGTDGKDGKKYGDFCYKKAISATTILRDKNIICSGGRADWTKCVCQ